MLFRVGHVVITVDHSYPSVTGLNPRISSLKNKKRSECSVTGKSLALMVLPSEPMLVTIVQTISKQIGYTS